MKTALELEVSKGWKKREWELFQLHHFVKSLRQPIRDGGELNPLENLCATPRLGHEHHPDEL